MSELHHNVSVRVGAKVIERWTDYELELDMMQAADGFRASLFAAGRKDAWDLCAPDAEIEVLLDDTAILHGFIDDRMRRVSRDAGSVIEITGRDKCGRLVDESMPLMSFRGVTLLDVVRKACEGVFATVTLQNARNRVLLRGAGAVPARVVKEPLFTAKNAAKKVEPGESRWQVISAVCEEAELLAWASGDGQELVVGLPNYDQEPQYRFFVPKEGSSRAREGNVLEAEIEHSVMERYSAIVACGSGQGDGANYSRRVTKFRSTVKNGPGAFGTGVDFQHRKVLIVADDDVRSPELAAKRATREMAERDGRGHQVTITVRGHSQTYAGRPCLYAPDTMCEFEDEETQVKGRYLVTAVSFRHTRRGEETALHLVPRGTVLT